MTAIVVDASVGVKWFVPEVHATKARRWRNGPDELHVPAFFFDLEIANILWKKVRGSEITRADADLILGQLPALPLTRHPEPPLLVSAFDLAERTQRTGCDSLYLALAVQLGGRMGDTMKPNDKPKAAVVISHPVPLEVRKKWAKKPIRRPDRPPKQ